jgi:hypothetical protein
MGLPDSSIDTASTRRMKARGRIWLGFVTGAAMPEARATMNKMTGFLGPYPEYPQPACPAFALVARQCS